jgi:colanic acid/amylovoran biosynthesis protein
MLRVFEHVDLIYARDGISHRHLDKLLGNDDRVRQAPDFTILAEGKPPADVERWSRTVCIVPNARLVDKTDDVVKRRYIPALVALITHIERMGFSAAILQHERFDSQLIEHIREVCPAHLDIVRVGAVEAKGILGSAFAVVSSRFHALVGALSQGTPSLGLGWSHKYTALLQEYGCPQCEVSCTWSDEQLRESLNLVTEPSSRSAIRAQLKEKALTYTRDCEAMWRDIEDLVRRRNAIS